jgi:hypothetical protein
VNTDAPDFAMLGLFFGTLLGLAAFVLLASYYAQA